MSRCRVQFGRTYSKSRITPPFVLHADRVDGPRQRTSGDIDASSSQQGGKHAKAANGFILLPWLLISSEI